ncbi:MAG: bifunctional transaldolase/phosoglucose isomerase [bacterium]|nr:bifunctional transaldolase/phosoglucose isomerase [bacterium]
MKELIGPYKKVVQDTLDRWQAEGLSEKLWGRDAKLWTGGDEDQWLGWLDLPHTQQAEVASLNALSEEIRKAGFRDVLVLGMGGSSMCPEVLSQTFGHVAGYPRLHVLDSTVPAQVKRFAEEVDLRSTLFIVASKSGSTTEPNVFLDYFLDAVRQVAGDEAGKQFVAITDPGSSLEKRAKKEGFRAIRAGISDVGGRFSALSAFGLVPAALMGVDVKSFLERAARMAKQCGPGHPVEENPGVRLGVVLGELARAGRDKVTLIASPGIAHLGAWLEQLVAESTGKEGTGLIPVDRELPGDPKVYGNDRMFIYLRLAQGVDKGQDAAVDLLAGAGHPVIRIDLEDPLDLGAEFFRWEVATVVAGAVLGIHPFDQPNVQESKAFTARLTEAYEKDGRLPQTDALLEEGGVEVFAQGENIDVLHGCDTIQAILAAHLGRLRPGDYLGICAYIDMTAAHETLLNQLRQLVRDRTGVATTLGFGPRFLHSTGQLHKGGPDSGVFLQITSEDEVDLPIPDRRFSFGVLKAAQALGDFEALNARRRRAIRLHFKRNPEASLRSLVYQVDMVMPQG